MNKLIQILFLFLFNSCSTEVINENNVGKNLKYEEREVRTNNPALFLGSDFMTFLSQLKNSNPGNYDTLLRFTSNKTKREYSEKDILEWYTESNLNFDKKLKSIKGSGDFYFLNYETRINATRAIYTFTIRIENDTCKLIPDVCSYLNNSP